MNVNLLECIKHRELHFSKYHNLTSFVQFCGGLMSGIEFPSEKFMRFMTL